MVHAGLGDVEFRAVEHRQWLPVTGGTTAANGDQWRRRLAEVTALRLPGEPLPSGVPAVLPNTRAAVSAYAESVTDGIHREMRDRLFDAIWIQRRNISNAYEVRRIIADLMCPRRPVWEYISAPGIATPVCGDPDLARITRRLGGTVTPDGGPLTTAAWRRIRDWRAQWLATSAPWYLWQSIPTTGPIPAPRACGSWPASSHKARPWRPSAPAGMRRNRGRGRKAALGSRALESNETSCVCEKVFSASGEGGAGRSAQHRASNWNPLREFDDRFTSGYPAGPRQGHPANGGGSGTTCSGARLSFAA